jgi:hypothetical protein
VFSDHEPVSLKQKGKLKMSGDVIKGGEPAKKKGKKKAAPKKAAKKKAAKK